MIRRRWHCRHWSARVRVDVAEDAEGDQPADSLFKRRRTRWLPDPQHRPDNADRGIHLLRSVRTEAQKAAWDNGYRMNAGASGLALLMPPRPRRCDLDRGRFATRAVAALDRAFRRRRRDRSVPLRPFLARDRHLFIRLARRAPRGARPRLQACRQPARRAARSLPEGDCRVAANTEAERLIVQRIGQDIFRAALIEYWGGRCPLTGITELELLRASHIVPWSDCGDEERLDVHNGLLLSALWDAAFDKGLVSFADDGPPIASPLLGGAARTALTFDAVLPIRGLATAAPAARLASSPRVPKARRSVPVKYGRSATKFSSAQPDADKCSAAIGHA